MAETQRYRVEVFRHDGIFLRQHYTNAVSALEAAKAVEPDLPSFYDRDDGPYVHVSLSPHRPGDGICGRCGEPRYRCGGETDPHE